MIIQNIISRVRAESISQDFIFGERVVGAENLWASQDKNSLTIPAIFIGLGDTSSDSNTINGTINGILTENLQIIVVLSNLADRRTQDPQQLIHSVRLFLFKCLLNYNFSGSGICMQNMRFTRDGRIDSDRARYFHLFEFAIDRDLTDIDGADLANLVDLRRVQGEIDFEGKDDEAPDVDILVDGLYPLTATASGAGTVVINGAYSHDDDFSDEYGRRPIYTFGNYKIEFIADEWVIYDSSVPEEQDRDYYFNDSDATFPPEDGWEVGKLGSLTAPIIILT